MKLAVLLVLFQLDNRPGLSRLSWRFQFRRYAQQTDIAGDRYGDWVCSGAFVVKLKLDRHARDRGCAATVAAMFHKLPLARNATAMSSHF